MRKVPLYQPRPHDGADLIESVQDLRVQLTLAIERLGATIQQTETLLVNTVNAPNVATFRARSRIR